MKIKPTLKTHWLSSQNPLLVDLNGLKSVIFKPSFAWLDYSLNGDGGEIQLPPTTTATQVPATLEETQQVYLKQNQYARDLFWIAFSGHEIIPFKSQLWILRRLIESIEFEFHDKGIMTLAGIHRLDKFPLFLSPHFYLTDRSCLWDKAMSSDNEFIDLLKIPKNLKQNTDVQKSWMIILEILAWALQRQRQSQDLQVVISHDSNSDLQPRKAILAKDIQFNKMRPLVVGLRALANTENQVELSFYQSHVEKEENVLNIYQVKNIFDEPFLVCANQDLPTNENEWLSSHTGTKIWQLTGREILTDKFLIEKTVSKLNSVLPAEKILFQNFSVLNESDLTSVVSIDSNEQEIDFSFKAVLSSKDKVHVNFPESLGRIIKYLGASLESLLKTDRKDIASKNLLHRQNDMSLLRHQGCVLFCVLEGLNWVLQKPLTSGININFSLDKTTVEFDGNLANYLNYLKKSIPGLLGKSSDSFENMFSSKVKEIFIEFIEELVSCLTDFRSVYFLNEQILDFSTLHKKSLLVLRFIILNLIEQTGGKALLKAQSAIGETGLNQIRLLNDAKLVSNELFFKNLFEPNKYSLGRFNKYMIHLLFELSEAEIEVEYNKKPFMSKENPFDISLKINDAENSEDGNWFDLHPVIFFNGQRVLSEEVKFNFTEGEVGFIEYKGQIYRIEKKMVPTLKSLNRFWNKIKGIKNSTARNKFGDQVFQLEKSMALEILMLHQQGIKIEVEGEWKKVFNFFESGLGKEKIHFSSELDKTLLPHQLKGSQWLFDLYQLRLGAILADEMGLGKTIQLLSFFSHLYATKDLGLSMIVVPTSLVYNWVEENKKFTSDLPIVVFQTADKNNLKLKISQESQKIILVTYGLLNENRDFFESYNWNIIAFDEAQNLKNITSIRSVSARKLIGKFKVCLTGTPMENNYFEFYSLCDLVVPGCLGEVDQFRRRYYNQDVRTELVKDLKLITKPIILRRTKTEVNLQLPEKYLQQVLLTFSAEQKEIYKKMAMTFSRQVEDLVQTQGESKAQIAMFSALMRLRQICSDPSAVPGVEFKQKPVKIDHFLNSIEDHLENEESVIVFTQFLTTLDRIQSELKKKNIPVFVLQGRIPAKERVQIISEFQKSNAPGVMLMTLKTGGVGLNLTKASVVYHLEPWWNPAVENQATDRAHRMGQTKSVKVFNLLIEGSLEERIQDLKAKKQDSFDRLFSNNENVDDVDLESKSSLTKEDFIYLLK